MKIQNKVVWIQARVSLLGNLLMLSDYPEQTKTLGSVNIIDLLPEELQQDGTIVELEIVVTTNTLTKRTKPDYIVTK